VARRHCSETLRTVEPAIGQLLAHDLGEAVHLIQQAEITGDAEGPARAVSDALGVDVVARMTPERKLAGIDFHDVAVGLSAAIVIMFMPFTFSITDGIAAGFVAYVLIRIFQRQWARVHPLMYASAIAFALYFAVPILQQEVSWI
jgi:hypothetical protein